MLPEVATVKLRGICYGYPGMPSLSNKCACPDLKMPFRIQCYYVAGISVGGRSMIFLNLEIKARIHACSSQNRIIMNWILLLP